MNMVYANPEGAPPSLVIGEGQTFTLSARYAHEAGIPLLKMQPRTTAALLTLAGLTPDNAPRLSEEAAFKKITNVAGLSSFSSPDQDGRVAGYSTPFLRGLLTTVDPTQDRLPRSVKKLVPQPTDDHGCKCKSKTPTAIARTSTQLAAGLTNTQNLQPSVFREIAVPDFLLAFQVYSIFTNLLDVVVGRNATLILDSDLNFAIARNFIAYQGSRIVQRGSYLNLDITGTIRGSVINLIHKVTDVVTIDLAALAAEPATKP
jgi:hypothetical protein